MDSPDPGWSRDPGWSEAIRGAWVFIVPGAVQLRMRRAAKKGADGLILLRSLFVGFASSIVIFAIVVTLLNPPAPDLTASIWVAVGLAVYGLLVIFVGIPVAERPLACESLAAQFRTRFFLRIALSETVALSAFVIMFVVGPAWIYYVGGAITLFGLALYAPTERNLMRDQSDLHARGCNQSLIAALRRPGPPPTR
jgi:F0F1-type ATP synthase membrane subunit c/vacuolar-type H+-ATPase subunit K